MKPDVLIDVKRTENTIFMNNAIVLILIGYSMAIHFKNHNVAYT